MAIKGIVFHWSAGKYDQVFEDYHYCITYNPTTKKAKIVQMCESDDEIKAHTWHRNKGRIGISLSCAYNATTGNLGQYPPTDAQIEMACALAGRLIKKHGIKPEDDEVNTHADWADYDNYGPTRNENGCERWDLWVPNWKNYKKNLGDVMKDKSWWYAQHGEAKAEEEVEKPAKTDPKFKDLVAKYAKEFDLREDFIHSIILQESSYNPKAVSSSNAKGLMQLLPATFADCLKALGLPPTSDPFSPEINIRCGCYYFSWLWKNLKNTKSTLWLLSKAYNDGPGTVRGFDPTDLKSEYADKVLSRIK